MSKLKYLIPIALFIGSFALFGAGPIGTLGTIPNIVVSGTTFTSTQLPNGSSVITLVAAGGNGYTTFRKMNGSSGYQVTSGKTLTIFAFRYWNNATTSSTASQLLYGTTDAGLSGSSPSNPFFIGGDGSAPGNFSSIFLNTAATTSTQGESISFNIPSGQFVTIKMPTGVEAHCILWGYEQ